MDDPAELEAEIAHHAELLQAHDPGDAAFAANATRFARLHRLLVPERGAATTVQGEIVRSVDRLAGEDRRNGNINWGDDYDAMVLFLRANLAKAPAFDAARRARIEQDLDVVLQNGRGEELSDSVRVDPAFGRLIVDAVAFTAAMPQPIPFAGEAEASGPTPELTTGPPRASSEQHGAPAGSLRLVPLFQVVWLVGAVMVALSWTRTVSATVGWVGFWLAVGAAAAPELARRFGRRQR